MSKNIVKFTFVAFLICYLSLNLALTPPVPPCNALVRCTFDSPLAWATDGTYCKVFYNACHLRNYYCQLAAKNLTVFKNTSEEQCTQNCRKRCTREFDPVCTDYKGESVEFANPCLWASKMCETKQPYIYQNGGICPPPPMFT